MFRLLVGRLCGVVVLYFVECVFGCWFMVVSDFGLVVIVCWWGGGGFSGERVVF